MTRLSITLAFLIVSITPIYPLIVQVSMMKSGTHLLISLLEKMTHKKLAFIGPEAYATIRQNKQDVVNVPQADFKRLSTLPNIRFWTTHSPYVPAYADVLSQTHYQIIYLHRDPRDVVVSMALYIRNQDKQFWPGAQKLSLDQTITQLIEGGESLHITSHHISKNGIKKVYDAYLPWLTLPNVLAVRFEDLIGPKGGGNLQGQIETIRAIARHINHSISDQEIIFLGEEIFGTSAVFNKGQIGSWQHYFTPEHKQLFKKHASQLLIDLGYESDLNW